MSQSPDKQPLTQIILNAARESARGDIPVTANIQGSAQVLAASLSHFLDTIGNYYPSSVSPEMRLQLFARDLLVSARRQAVERLHQPLAGVDTRVLYVNRRPLILDVTNQEQVITLNLDADQRMMFGYFAAKTHENIRRHTLPHVSRQDLESASNGAYPKHELRRRLFDPLQDAGLVSSSNEGYLLQAPLKQVKQALVSPDDSASLKVTPFQIWQSEAFGNTLVPGFLVPTIKAVATLAQERPGADRITRDELAQMTGKSVSQIRNDLAKLKDLGLLAQGIRSKGMLVQDLSSYIKIMVANFDSPAVEVKLFEPSHHDAEQSLPEDLELPTAPIQSKKEKSSEINPYLMINMESHRGSIQQVARLDRNPRASHRPAALNHKLRRLNTFEERGQFPWRELLSLGLARHERDHHKELFPVGALIALYFTQEDVAQAARLAANGSKGVIEVMSRHTDHILNTHLSQIDTKDLEPEFKEKMVKFLEGSLAVLKELRLDCQCPECIARLQQK